MLSLENSWFKEPDICIKNLNAVAAEACYTACAFALIEKLTLFDGVRVSFIATY